MARRSTPRSRHWPRALKEAGYQTAVVGKWHIGRTPEGLKFDYWKVLDDQGEYYNPDFITRGGHEPASKAMRPI